MKDIYVVVVRKGIQQFSLVAFTDKDKAIARVQEEHENGVEAWHETVTLIGR